jgi:hypothetical protein
MKIATLLQAMSSLQAQSNYLSDFNDRKYGTWKAIYNIKAVRLLVDINLKMKFL